MVATKISSRGKKPKKFNYKITEGNIGDYCISGVGDSVLNITRNLKDLIREKINRFYHPKILKVCV